MIVDEDDYLAHYGIARRSGRYPWGSGGNVEKRSKNFLDHVANLKAQGLSDAEIGKGVGMTSTEIRQMKTLANNAIKTAEIAQAQKLKDTGMSNTAIGAEMGKPESSVRALLKSGEAERAASLQILTSTLKDQVDQKNYIDVGTGVENYLGVSKERLSTALFMLKNEGYVVENIQVDQLGTAVGKKTLVKVLAKPGEDYQSIKANAGNVKFIQEFSDDRGRSFQKIMPPKPISSRRIEVKYGDEGGKELDGVIYVRPGKPELSLGNDRYAQVRIAVDGTHFLKGMAIYKDDLPPGVDLQFNTAKLKTPGDNKLAAMKPMKKDKEGNIDPDNPFGSALKPQITKLNPDGTRTVTSVMNKVNEEGAWDLWRKSLSSQVLSKQSPALAQEQLGRAYEDKKKELDEIMALTNPAVKRKLLEGYADGADAAAVHLKAAALPRQTSQVILPINGLKDTEVYAPNFRHGERVVLIRHPHGGPFEIPELVVNNNHPEAKRLLGTSTTDAIGINSKVAERLSGADFDGDAVLVIPNPASNRKIKTAPPLEGLKGFDPQKEYAGYEGMKVMNSTTKGFEMGNVSNLITDMTIRGATSAELARAVRHSMVVIDAEKHGLDWKRSAQENTITALKKKYQGVTESGRTAGASTLISRASSRKDVNKRRLARTSEGGPIDPKTGKLRYVDEAPFVNKKGQTVFKKIQSTKLAEVDDAFELSSGTRIESVYANHSNRMKALANDARKELVRTPPLKYSESSAKIYKEEVDSLKAKLNIAYKNRPLERQAQVIANATIAAKRQANPDMDADDIKKVSNQALQTARVRTGADKQQIRFDDREWEAIQAGAISNHRLTEILRNSDLDSVKSLATPKTPKLMTSSKTARAMALLSSGKTQAEVADILGVSLTTLKKELR